MAISDEFFGRACHRLAHAIMARKAKFAIIIKGGNVHSVVSTEPALIGASFAMVDYDTDGADPDELDDIVQEDGTIIKAFVFVDKIGADTA